ncbi:MAG TPA: hypothetical protein VEJ89_03900 [Myxococcaceae bacterium]|nr:hypothetical protein [Myxococcaceae bacterium]
MSASRTRTLLLSTGVLSLALAASCSHGIFGPGPDQLRSSSEDFEKSLRFQDYGGAAALVAPARRSAFLAARRKEANDLTITDMEVIDVQMGSDGQKAMVLSRMRWVKLPSVSEVSAEVQANWQVMGTSWYLVSLAGGPFPELAPAH